MSDSLASVLHMAIFFGFLAFVHWVHRDRRNDDGDDE